MNGKVVCAVAVCLLLAMTASGNAAVEVQFGMTIDGSGSMSASEWSLQKAGIVDGLNNNIGVDEYGKVEVSVGVFGSTASVPIGPSVINNATDLLALTNAIAALVQPGGGTPMASAITTLADAMLANPNGVPLTAVQIMNISTDGDPNSNSATANAAAAAQVAGIEGLSAEGVGTTASTLNFLASIVFPGVSPGPIVPPGTIPIPHNPFLQGFVAEIQSFDDYAAVIDEKIRLSVGPDPVPEPASIFVFAGLSIVVVLGRFGRKRKAA